MNKSLAKTKNAKICMLIVFFFVLGLTGYFSCFFRDEILVGGDGIGLLGVRKWIYDNLRGGEFPLWNKYNMNGMPLEHWYLPNYILSFLPSTWGFFFYRAFHISLAGSFSYLYFRKLNCQKLVSICVAVLYCFSVQLGGSRIEHTSIQASMCYLPVEMYLLTVYSQSRKFKDLALLAVAMAFSYLGGFSQCELYKDGVLFLLLIMFSKKQDIKKMLWHIPLWIILYVLLISPSIVSTARMMQYYKSLGAGQVAEGYLDIYSLHPFRLLKALFPMLFENVGVYSYSTGLDNELFIGVVAIIIGAITLFYERKNKYVQKMLVTAALLVVYAAHAHIPFITKIISKIPMLNSFRVPSRVMFIVIFMGYTMLALGMNRIIEDDNQKNYRKGIKAAFIVISILTILLYVTRRSWEVFCSDKAPDNNNIQNYIYAVIIALIFLVLYELYCGGLVHGKWKQEFLIVAITLICILEVKPYSYIQSRFPASLITYADQNVDWEEGKSWLATAAYSKKRAGKSVAVSLAHSRQIAVLNTYTAFNNPALYYLLNGTAAPAAYNQTGLLDGVYNIENVLYNKYDLLSMLGVKYIADYEERLPDEGFSKYEHIQGDTIFSQDELQLATEDEMAVESFEIKIEPKSYYKIRFQAEANCQDLEMTCDFYGGAAYDEIEQNKILNITDEEDVYEFEFYSGDIVPVENVYLRFILVPDHSEIQLENIGVYHMEDVLTNIYELYYEENGERIFYNNYANEILYVPSAIVNIEDCTSLYNAQNCKLDTIAYLENSDYEGENGTAEIKEVDFKNSSISALVNAEGRTFICFSQNYFPGWKAYIDGEEVENYVVNSLIQGTYVEAGVHEIEFKYRPTILFVCVGISMSTFMGIILYQVYYKRKYAYVESSAADS